MGVAKTSKKNKMPRRIKRAIRKTLSGICMVSAIIVALVPASDSRGYTKIPASEVLNNNYLYGVDQSAAKSDDIALSSGMSLNSYKPVNKLSDSNVYKTLYVRTDPQGNYEYGWQFRVYMQNYKGSSQGVICDYNSSYESDMLEINKYLPTEYVTVPVSEYENFYQAFYDAKAGDLTPTGYVPKADQYITIDGNKYKYYFQLSQPGNTIIANTDEYYIEKYFNSEYLKFLKDYADWKEKSENYKLYKEWESNGSVGSAPNSQTVDPGDMETLYVYVSDMSSDNRNLLKRQYFCDINAKYNNASISLAGYTLVIAYDYCATAVGTERPQIYLAQGEPNKNFETGETGSGTSSNNDSLGFFVKQKTSVIAIGEQAFKGIYNVDEMLLSSDIAYIGDEAFIDSYVKSISFSNVSEIGNRAFKNCSQLATIELGKGTTLLGTESFYGCGNLKAVEFPYSVKRIGPGAFAYCINMLVADMSQIGQSNCEVDAFAFYNDIALADVRFSDTVTKVGDSCFACEQGATGGLYTFTFPKNINDIGDYMLAGRGNLKVVNMPENYGRTQSPAAKLPEHIFWNCFNIDYIEFPDDGMGSCGYVDFANCDLIFSTITNDNFHVRGPKYNANKKDAYPRTSTWGKLNGTNKQVPYVYIDSDGEKKYEISDELYILSVNDEGVLMSCIFDPTKPVKDVDMFIPETVAGMKVTGISSGCFNNEDLRKHMVSLTISDNTISSIDDGAFKDFTKLSRVNIGNSVNKIGNSAFEGCYSLTYVQFNTPSSGYASFPADNIGSKAFSTGAPKLTFEGDINEAYGPFVWATDPDNFVNKDEGVRVCYKTGAPSYMTVIVDNRNGLATLVDYPHYEQLNKLSGTENDTVSVSDSDLGNITLSTSLIDRYEKISSGITSVTDSKTGALIYSYSLSLAEESLLDNVFNIKVPAGIESIDAQGFMTSTSKLGDGYSNTATNSKNVSLYCLGLDDYATYNLFGLFNGYYGTDAGNNTKREYKSIDGMNDSREKVLIGNDRIQSIEMNTVEYLPDNAFNSCEQLSKVVLGPGLKDLGNAPFSGCNNLSSVGSSTSDIICENGILYTLKPDGTYNINEVLSSRGISVGAKKVRVSDADPKLANVSTISPGAFANCDGITGVDLSGMESLTNIPDNCFYGCDNLYQVIVPNQIATIGHDAFADCMDGIEVVIYGREVFLPFDAFGTQSDGDLVDYKRVVSYKDSAVYKAAKDIGADVSDTLDETYRVQFVDYDGTPISKVIYVEEGKSVSILDLPADPQREGFIFTGWNKDYTNITEDTTIVATYKEAEKTPGSDNPSSGSGSDNPSSGSGSDNPSSGSGSDNPGSNTTSGSTSTSTSNSTSASVPAPQPQTSTSTTTSTSNPTSVPQGSEPTTSDTPGSSDVTPTEPVEFYTLTVTNGNGSGSYAEGAIVIITVTDIPEGKEFDKWVPTTTDLGIASVNVAATTLVMPSHEASVTATFKDKTQSNSSNNNNDNPGSSDNGSGNNGNNSGNGQTVVISKPGISNTGLASATVSGSNDNYVIRISETAQATQAIETALTNEFGSLDNVRYTAMDITLYDATGTNRITDYNGLSVTITLPIPDVMTQYAGNNKVAGVVNEKLDKLDAKFTTIDGVPCITFTATHFSPYTIYVNTQNISESGVKIDESPKTGDGIHPKWFLVAGLAALSIALFFMKDKKPVNVRSFA